MLFSARLPTQDLIDLCRSLRHQLDAGISLVRVFNQLGQKSSPTLRAVAGRMAAVLEQGDDLGAALDRERAAFPPLFLALVGVGEESGNLPEVFGALEKYYQFQLKIRRQFRSQITLPVMQFVAATFVIAGMIFVLGFVAQMSNSKPLDPLGIGLVGTSGALTFLLLVWGTVGALAGAYVLAGRYLRQRAIIDRLLLRLPALGPCLEALALARFCLALRLTLDSALPIGKALRLSLQATGNAALSSCAEGVQRSLRQGEDLSVALADCGQLPEEFLNIVAVAEEGGRLPEVMRHQAAYFEEEAGRRLTVLARVSGFGVWAFVAMLIAIAVVRLALKAYIEPLSQFQP